MSKETRLDDDAMIYQKTDKQSEKEKLKEMSWNQKLSYLLGLLQISCTYINSISCFCLLFYIFIHKA